MARYTKDENGNLILTAGGTRTWIVTQAAHDRAVSAGTAPNNCLVAITDDYPTEEGMYDISDAVSVRSATGSCTVTSKSIKAVPCGDYLQVFGFIAATITPTSASKALNMGLTWSGYTPQAGMIVQLSQAGVIEVATTHTGYLGTDNYLYNISDTYPAGTAQANIWCKLTGLVKKN